MAETKKKSKAKAKKSEPKSKMIKSTLDAAAAAKASKGSSDTSDSSDSAADSGSADYSIGEGQKTVTKAYRKGWDSIFSNKR